MALTGEAVDAATALRWGLINRIVPADQVLDSAMALAETIAANAPLAVRATKRIIHQGHDYGSNWNTEIWDMSVREYLPAFRSADAKEGTWAFAEKRRPRWIGA